MTVSRPDPAELERFAQSNLASRDNRRIVRGLLTTWRACRSEIEQIWSREEQPPTPEAGPEIDLGLSRLTERLLELTRDRERVPELAARLDALSTEDRKSALRSNPAFRSWSFCEWLIEECHRLTDSDVTRAEDLADFAVAVAESLDPRLHGEPLINDLKARAWSAVGEVLRSLSDLRSSDEAFEIAEGFIGEGTGDALEEARLLELKAALRRDQRRLPEACRLLDEVVAIYRQYRDFHLVGRGFIQKGRVCLAGDDLEAAVRWLRKGLSLLEPARERHLELSARHNLMLALHESDCHQEAWFLLKASRSEIREPGGEILNLRMRWLEGKLQHALGSPGEAEEALVEARAGFIARGIGFSAAAVSLDLAGLYADQGRPAPMRRLAEEMLPIFQSRDLHREAIAALLVFQQAVRIEKLSTGLLEEIRSYLKRARKDYKLRFESSVD
jgi:tetratricopeptide (TPR) repeat protein